MCDVCVIFWSDLNSKLSSLGGMKRRVKSEPLNDFQSNHFDFYFQFFLLDSVLAVIGANKMIRSSVFFFFIFVAAYGARDL